MDKFTLLKQFITVVEQGGFAAAAKELGLSPSTLSKSIARLEVHLAIKLFNRSTRQVRLTQAGSQYLIAVTDTLHALDQSEQQLRKDNRDFRGRLRVNLPVSYGRLYIVPLIQQFNQRYPEITLELSFNDRYVDMLEKGIDLSLRTGHVDDSNLVARKISPIDYLICAAPDYIEKHPSINEDNLAKHPWIRFRYPQTGQLMPIMLAGTQQALHLENNNQYVVDDGEALASLCAQGLGLTQIPHFIARDWLQAGKLKVVQPYYRVPQRGVWAIYPNREYLPAKVQALVSFLIEKMEQLGESTYHTWVEELEL